MGGRCGNPKKGMLQNHFAKLLRGVGGKVLFSISSQRQNFLKQKRIYIMSFKVAVLISGGGSNLQALIDHIEGGRITAEISLVLSNKKDAYGLKRAEKHGLPSVFVDHKAYPRRKDFDAVMIEHIKASGADVVVLAGFMRLLTPSFIHAFPSAIVNIHPALLPAFPGCHGVRDAVQYGVKLAGCTVHFVDEIMDNGPVIIQAAVPVHEAEDEADLAARILECEHRIYPQAVQWLATGRLSIKQRHVFLKDAGVAPAASPAKALIHPALEQGF